MQMMSIKDTRNYLVGKLLVKGYGEVFGAWKGRDDLGETDTWVRNIRKLMSARYKDKCIFHCSRQDKDFKFISGLRLADQKSVF